MSDKLRFILSSSANFFDVGPARDDAAVHEFLESEDVQLLSAYKRTEQGTEDGSNNNNNIKLAFTLQSDPDVEESLQFYKVPIGHKDFKVGVLSIRGGLVNTIYNSVAKVFSPKLSLRQRSVYSSDVAQLLEQLQERISSNLGLPQTGITSLSDEAAHWRQTMQIANNRADTERAGYFVSAFDELHEQLVAMSDHNSLAYIEDSIDPLNAKLDELWKSPKNYPENRMVDVLDVIALNIVEMCCDQLSNDDLWSGNTLTTSANITHVQDVLDSWNQVCDTLTRLFWPNYAQRQWLSEPHVPRFGTLLKARLHEITTLRSLHTELSNLFTDDPQTLNTMLGQMFRPFRRMNILDISSLGLRKWQAARTEMERILRPIDEKIAILLKSKLNGHLANPRQMMFIFTKYRVMTERKSVLEFLRTERQHFLEAVSVLTGDLQKALTETLEPDNNRNNLNSTDDLYLSEVCCECRFLRTCEQQIDEILSIAHMLQLDSVENELLQQLSGLKEDVRSALATSFERWCLDSEEGIKTGVLSLQDDRSVVEFDKSDRQQMHVTFDAQLITFCFDYKELEVLGFRVPAHLKHVVNHAKRFIRHARQLQQIAAFHNTIGDRMIPCQRPIMLKNAVELASLVQSENVPWNDEESVERYVKALQDCVSRLSKTNSTLVHYHERLKDIVVRLMSLDLVRQAPQWKGEMKRMREIVAEVEAKGYENLQGLKLHWDHQLYKVLEYQYVSGLLHLNHKLPDINLEITFRQQQLHFRPALEEVRTKYFAQLRKFTEKPLDFHGVSSSERSDFFRPMLERNRHYFAGLYKQAELLFEELTVFRDKWLPWVALGFLELDDLCRVHLVEWEDWDRNFRECKHLSQQVAKIQTTTPERIECFVIDMQPLKMDVEFICRRFWEALANSLRASIVDHLSTLDEFVRAALNTLQTVSTTSGVGIAETSAKYERIKVELPQMERLLGTLKAKDTCLAGWCKERVASLSAVEGRWDQLQPLIENHSEVLQQHIVMMKEQVVTHFRNLSEEAEKFLIRWQATMREIETNDTADLHVYGERKGQWAALVERRKALESDCAKYNILLPEGEIFKNVEAEMIQSGQLQWDIYLTFVEELSAVTSEEWIVYRRRPYAFNDFLAKWQSDAVLSQMSPATTRIRRQIDLCTSLAPTLQIMQSDALSDKHWATIFNWLREPIRSFQDIQLKDVLKESLLQHSDDVQALVKQASSELIVKQALSELEQWGAVASFKLLQVSDSQGVPLTVIRDYQEVLNKIGDHQCLLQSARNSSAFESFNDQAELWEGRLSTLDLILTQLSKVQRKWIYLEPVFRNKTIGSDTADTTFMRIDKDFRYLMREIAQDPRVLSLLKLGNVTNIVQGLDLQRCQNVLSTFVAEKRNAFPRFYFLNEDDLLELLGQSNKDAVIQRHIKKLFPAINQVGIEAREETAAVRLICHIRSAEGDTMSLVNPIEISGSVEDWLNKLDLEIKATLKASLTSALRLTSQQQQQQPTTATTFAAGGTNTDTSSSFVTPATLSAYPMQVLCLCRAINFTRDLERAIPAMNLASTSKAIMTEIDQLTNLISIHSDTANTTAESALVLKLKCKALLLDLVHYARIVRLLVRQHVTNPQDWHWLKQMRFYATGSGGGTEGAHLDIKIRMVYAEFDYSFEYLGNVNKLVNTRLTERCYLTLTQSMQLGLGGNPFGPSGTGKTECVKSLGALLGRLVLVFNCNENVDSQAIGLILIGLARSGAWGCFDEFNRLQEQTLSAISMQIQPLQQAVKSKSQTVTILKQTIPLDLHCGVFVTLNPAGEDYGGRQKLPGNIQDLFRPIVMQQPEPKEICKVMLFVEGFKNVEATSDRVVELFALCSKMLSPQRHYDWGLRELKTMLTACGNALRTIKQLNETKTTALAEQDVIASVLRTSISSKLTVPDSNIFNLLMSIIFPSANPNALAAHGQELIDGLASAFSGLGLVVNNRQIGKCVELQDQLTKRLGVMLVGRPGTGKTTLINALRQTLVAQGRQIRTYTISPKSMSLERFLGELNVDTRQWQDGVLTSTAIAVTSEPPDITSWIICDGDVDPVWIESLNSVLDDNKLLTLPSGWRIQFGSNVNFLFETHDLQHASPATISRMGVINVNPEDFPETLLVDRFYLHDCRRFGGAADRSVADQEQPVIKLFIEKYLWRAIDWMEQRAQKSSLSRSSSRNGRGGGGYGFMPFPGVVGRSNWINWALQAIRIQNNCPSAGAGEGNNNYGTSSGASSSTSTTTTTTTPWSKERFCMVLVNSLGSALPTADDKVAFIRAIMYDCMELPRLHCSDEELSGLYFDARRQVLDVYCDEVTEGVGGRRIPINNNSNPPRREIDQLLIRTPQIRVYLDVLQELLSPSIDSSSSSSPPPVLIIGPSGSGKALLIREAVAMANGYQLVTINCSAQLSAGHILYVLRENFVVLSGVRGREYKPKLKKTILLLKNLNLLRVDCYGSSDVVELLLQIVYRSGFYETNDWISVSGLQVCATLTTIDPTLTTTTTTTSAEQELNKLSPRFINLCRYLIVAGPREADLRMIIARQLECLSFVNWKIRPESIAKVVLDVFNQLRERLLLQPSKGETSDEGEPVNAETLTNNKNNRERQSRPRYHPHRQRAPQHYDFSPKMISRTIKYLQRYQEDNLAEAVCYELAQIFRNRLSTADDVKTFDEILSNNIPYLAGNGDIQTSFLSAAAFMPQAAIQREGTAKGAPTATATFQLVPRDQLRNVVVPKHIEVCNTEDIRVEMPVSETLLDNILAIARVVCQPTASHLVLCGSVGAGRREAVHIVANLMQFKLHTIQATRNYGKNDFYNDLKAAMQSAADANTVLLVDFTWLNHCPEIMGPVEAILEGSDIPELFGDDLESVAAPLKQAALNDNYSESIGSYFMKRVQRNLHLIVLLEREEDAYLTDLFDQYPALYRNAEMCWSLPVDGRGGGGGGGVSQMAEQIQGLCKLMDCTDINIPSYATQALLAVPLWHRSPLRLQQFIKTFASIHSKTTLAINSRCNVLKRGIEKLSEAHQIVDTLRDSAKQQQEALNEKRKLAAQSLELISSTMRSASDQKTDLLELRKATEGSSRKLQERTRAIELQLKEVEPLLKEARSAVGQIKSEALSEIRSLRAPPEVIRDILEGVLRIMGIRDTSWNSMKSFLAKRGIKEDIRSLDPARITPENCAAIQKLLATKSESFDEKIAKRASVAAAPLAAWVIANVEFAKVSQSIRPLEREQEELQRNLQKAEADMQSLTNSLDDVDARVKELSQQLNLYTQEAAVLEIKLEEVQQTLKSAEMLVSKLGAEFRTWSQEHETLQRELATVDEQVFLRTLTLTHLSGFSLEERNNILLHIAHKIPELQMDLNLITEQEKIQWDGYGLTLDQQSMENAAFVKAILEARFKSIPIPCLLDPSEYAQTWLVNFLTGKSLSHEITNQADERFAYKLELAIRFGKILVVTDVERFSASLLSIIVSETHVRYNKRLLQVGNKLVDLHDDFKLILVTRKSTLDDTVIRMDVACRITQVPFVNTESGYCDQLVAKSICLMRPELEEKRVRLLEREGQLLEERGKLQEKLLAELSTASGDLLRNESLIKSLNAAKESSDEIDRSLKESQDVRARLHDDFAKYRKLCAKVAALFMGVASTYRISTQTYTGAFLKVLQRTRAEEEESVGGGGAAAAAEEHKQFRRFIHQIYFTIARTIAKSEYTQLGLLICKNAYPDLIPTVKWEPFITNFMASSPSHSAMAPDAAVAAPASPLPDWLRNKDSAAKLSALASCLPSLYAALNLNDEHLWREFMAVGGDSAAASISNEPHFPVQLDEFDKVLITQILRPDLLLTVLRTTVTKLLGFNYTAVAQPSVHQLAVESRPDKPVLILSDPGTDPSRELRELAVEKEGQQQQPQGRNYIELSVAQGQEQETLAIVRNAVQKGGWVCLKNIHLLPGMIRDLETELLALSAHSDFRLWIICESLNGFSETFIMKSISVLFELPNGLKLKVQRLLRMWESSLTATGGGGSGGGGSAEKMRDGKFLKLAFALFLFTGILQERRNFIPQGFTKWYDFADSDLRVAIDFVQMLLLRRRTKANSGGSGGVGGAGGDVADIEWNFVQKIIEIVAFGGRLNNEQDLKVLVAHVRNFFRANLFSPAWNVHPLMKDLVHPVPQSARPADYHDYLNNAFGDALDNPQNFGLPRNARALQNVQICRQLLKQLRNAYYNDKSNRAESKRSQDNLEKRLKPILSLWKNLTAKTSLSSLSQQQLDKDSSAEPWRVFQLSEVALAGTLFETIQSTLFQLYQRAKEEATDTRLVQLCDNQVPAQWRKLWNGPRAATNYLKATTMRALQAEQQRDVHSPPQSMDLSRIFNVDTFFAALKLIAARDYVGDISTTEITLELRLRGAKSSSAKEDLNSIVIAPLLIEGGLNFDKTTGMLTKVRPSRENKPTATPELILVLSRSKSPAALNDAKDEEDDDDSDDDGELSGNECVVPLYSNGNREKLIHSFRLPIERNLRSWATYSSTALIIPDLPVVVEGNE